MAQFPTREADIRALCQNMVTGLTDNPGVYPAPPVSAADLQALLTSVDGLIDQVVAADAAAELVTETKNAGVAEMVAAMKANLAYAENLTNDNDAQLSLIGWGARATPTPSVLELPGQPRDLEAPKQGEGWVFLDWKTPADGGKVATYRVERRERPAGDWGIVGVALETELMLTNQERGKDWEYRVIALNQTGRQTAANLLTIL
ncbi:MAG: fibronectin type III domain-containing protein, partial [Candidatus Hydrogenedentes bacterium]|nr:fibronectin type III domain-containing protein [Candidatus Hydrogenedentota bacterium]